MKCQKFNAWWKFISCISTAVRLWFNIHVTTTTSRRDTSFLSLSLCKLLLLLPFLPVLRWGCCFVAMFYMSVLPKMVGDWNGTIIDIMSKNMRQILGQDYRYSTTYRRDTFSFFSLPMWGCCFVAMSLMNVLWGTVTHMRKYLYVYFATI